MAFGNGYTYRRSVTVDHTQVPATQSDFPIVVIGSLSYLATVANGGLVESASGYDIIFTSDLAGSTLLDFERVAWNAATGEIQFWVRVPSLSASADTVIYLFYGNASVVADQQNAAGVWNSNYKNVYHLEESSSPYHDSTSGARNSNAGNYPTQTTGHLGKGQVFASGSSNYIGFPNGVTSGNHLVLMCWASLTGSPSTDEAFVDNRGNGSLVGGVIASNHGDSDKVFVYMNPTNSPFPTYSSSLRGGGWHHFALHCNGVVVKLYVDGALIASQFPSGGFALQTTGSVYLGAAGNISAFMNGSLDEVRVMTDEPSANWIATEYAAQNSPGTFYAIGSQQTSNTTITFSSTLTGPRSVPSPVVAGPIKFTSTLTHGRSVPTPTVLAPSTIVPAPCGPHRNFPNPTVAGPITFTSTLAHGRAIPSPTIRVAQTISFGTLSPAVDYTLRGPRAIPSPTVAFIKVISFSSTLAHARSIPSPVIKGGPQWLNVSATCTGPRFVPIPTIDGGLQDTRIYIGGVDRTFYFSFADSLCQVQSQTIGRWKASLAFQRQGTDTWAPVLGQTVLIVDHGYRVFAGCISEVTMDRYMMTSDIVQFRCTATDKSAICDRRVVTGKTYPAGLPIAAVVSDLVVNFLGGEGIINGQALDAPFGNLTADLPFNFVTVTQAFDSVANLAGLVWWVDQFGILHFSPFTDLPAAPFEFTETSLNWRNASGSYGMTVTQSTTDYYNKLYATSNLNILPGAGTGGGSGSSGALGNTETFHFSVGSPGIRTVTNSMGVEVAVGIVCSAVIGSIQSLTVNGVDQTTVDFGAFAGEVPNPPDLLWFFAGPATGSPSNGVSPEVLPADGDVIVIQYTPSLSTSSSVAQYGSALTPLDPHGDPLGTCGSGIFEGVIQVQNVSSQGDLNAIAAADLARIGGVPTVIRTQTDLNGLEPGQKLRVNVPKSGAVNLDTLVTAVSGTFIAPELSATGSFRWDVEARSNLDPGNWVKWFERLIARTANPLPIAQYEECTFILGSGSTLSGGVSITNPYLVGRTGKVVELLAAASEAPTNQDLIMQVFANGGATLVGTLTLPAGTPANTLIAVEISDSLNRYVFARDVLNVDAGYSVTGTGTPTKASGVTLKVRWTM